MGVNVGKEWHVGYQLTAVEAFNLLYGQTGMDKKDMDEINLKGSPIQAIILIYHPTRHTDRLSTGSTDYTR